MLRLLRFILNYKINFSCLIDHFINPSFNSIQSLIIHNKIIPQNQLVKTHLLLNHLARRTSRPDRDARRLCKWVQSCSKRGYNANVTVGLSVEQGEMTGKTNVQWMVLYSLLLRRLKSSVRFHLLSLGLISRLSDTKLNHFTDEKITNCKQCCMFFCIIYWTEWWMILVCGSCLGILQGRISGEANYVKLVWFSLSFYCND